MYDCTSDINYSSTLSLLEILIAFVIMGILGISAMKSITSLRQQDTSLQKFLVKHTSLFETQLFINKYLALSKPDTIQIFHNKIQWEGYNNLFHNAQKNQNYMDFSLQTDTFSLELHNGNLYLNQSLLLENVRLFDTQIQMFQTSNTTTSILEYNLCADTCVQDFVILEESEIQL